MKTEAVIFDMDGLLVDSERIGIDVMHGCGLLQGYDLAPALIRRTLGSNKQSSSNLYHQYFPLLDTDRLFLDFSEQMRALAVAGRIPLMPGAPELLAFLKEHGVPRAVASSSGIETIRAFLAADGVLDAFDALITANGLPSKPAPDVFLKAAAALSADPAHCLVLEDSINGVKAGRAAGMTVCMVPDQMPFTEELRPFCDHVLPDLAAVIPLVKP